VTFVTPDGERHSATIATDGVYTLDGVPAGPVKIAVESHPRVPRGLTRPVKDAPPERPREAPFVRIPPHYKAPEKSGLTYVVKEGSQTFDVPLK
jgi:hypothetical protein